MFKAAFVAAFILTVVTYAVCIYLWPSVPPDGATLTVVFAIWFGLSLLARWFYGKPRVGEIFFREGTARSTVAGPLDAAPAAILSGSARRNSEWPYRRILRACSRLLAPPGETEESPQPRVES